MAKQHKRDDGEGEGLLAPCREKSPTSMIRKILSLGYLDMVEETHMAYAGFLMGGTGCGEK